MVINYCSTLLAVLQHYVILVLLVIFRDIFSVLADPSVFQDLISVLKERVTEVCPDVEIILGLDSRGFLFGTPLALAFGVPFVPVRKRGKLPGEVKQVTYTLEYGTVSTASE